MDHSQPSCYQRIIKANQIDFCFYFGSRKLQENVILTVGLELGLEEEGGCENTSEAEMGRHKAYFGGNV